MNPRNAREARNAALVVLAAASATAPPLVAAGDLCGRAPLDILLTNDDGYEANKTPPAAQADTDIAWLALGYITVTPLDANYASSSPEVAKLRSLIDGQTAAR